jgi:hypothetical protein
MIHSNIPSFFSWWHERGIIGRLLSYIYINIYLLAATRISSLVVWCVAHNLFVDAAVSNLMKDIVHNKTTRQKAALAIHLSWRCRTWRKTKWNEPLRTLLLLESSSSMDDNGDGKWIVTRRRIGNGALNSGQCGRTMWWTSSSRCMQQDLVMAVYNIEGSNSISYGLERCLDW